jgi:hypothetical protein
MELIRHIGCSAGRIRKWTNRPRISAIPGDEKFFAALKTYYSTYSFRISGPEQFRGAFLNVAEDPRAMRTLFQRWLREKHGDEDIGAPDLTLLSPSVSKIRAFGRVFVKIGKTAVKPF